MAMHAVIELKAVIEDFRMHKLGAISSALDVFNLAIVPALLYNSETWLDAPNSAIEKLENVQVQFLRSILAVPSSTPITALTWDTGQLSMNHRINVKKLNFIHYVVNLDDSILAKEIFNLQKCFNFPGFIPEAKKLLEFYGLPEMSCMSVIGKAAWKRKVNEAAKNKYEEEQKTRINQTYSKLKEGPLSTEEFSIKEYLFNMNLEDARTNFRIRSKMIRTIKMNQKTNPVFARQLWACDACGNIDTQSHIMWCPEYRTLREDLDINNDLDLVKYFQQVVKARESTTLG